MGRARGATTKASASLLQPRSHTIQSYQYSSHPSLETKPFAGAEDAKVEVGGQDNDGIEPQEQHQQAMVQVPADTLTTILSTIKRLSQDVVTLSQKVSQMESDASIHATRTQMQLSRLRYRTKRYAKKKEKLAAELKESKGRIPRRDEPCTTFTCFNKLPVELRLQIWTFALNHREIVPVAMDLEESGLSDLEISLWCCQDISMKTSRLKSAILQVNREARREALRRLRLIQWSNTKTYISLASDTLWLVEAPIYFSSLDYETHWDMMDNCMDVAKSIAVSYNFWSEAETPGRRLLEKSDAIEELILLVGNERGLHKARPKFITPAHDPRYYFKADNPFYDSTWEGMAARVLQQIKEQRDAREAEREQAIDGMIEVSEPEMVEDSGMEDILFDCELWRRWESIRAIKFMEVVAQGSA